MRNFVINYFSERYLAQWVVWAFDVFAVFNCFLLAVFLRLNFEWTIVRFEDLFIHAIYCSAIYGVCFIFYKSYNAIIRYASLRDLQEIMKVTMTAFLILIFQAYLLPVFWLHALYMQSKSVLIIHFVLTLLVLSIGRLIVRRIYSSFLNSASTIKKKILIYGAGETGLIAKQTLNSSTSYFSRVVGFIDENPSIVGKTLEGVKVYNPSKLLQLDFLSKLNIEEVVIASETIEPLHKSEIVETCLKNKINVKQVPPHYQWINGELSSKQIKSVAVEDLLGRNTISMNNPVIKQDLKDKVLMVTGGAGSIGSEIVRQVLHFGPKLVIILDQAETAIFELEYEIKVLAEKKEVEYEVVIGNVRDRANMRAVMKNYHPDIIFHAAAYKHVPLMEMNPIEAISTNIFGTKVIADLALEFGVAKFVMISTDKAVNPTNVMGATKRAAEMYVQSLSSLSRSSTQFITTRFGNVLGSNGSVIPLFKKQIENGGPVTITHKEITRYFMTISEACNLVLEAGVMGFGGEIFIFDMGHPVKIIDLAKKMIQLSGLKIGDDIEIKMSGLRPGEKLYEELMLDGESSLPTHHPKIHISKLKPIDVDMLWLKVNELEKVIKEGAPIRAVVKLKSIVPEYSSKNSEFEFLDTLNNIEVFS